MIETITRARDAMLSEGWDTLAGELTEVLKAFDEMVSTAAQIIGAKGGNTPVKPGSRPRGRPRKDQKQTS